MSEILLMEGCCLSALKEVADSSIDLIYADPPFGTTQNRWDSEINLNLLWSELFRVSKHSSPIVLHCCEPFTSVLICSNLKYFKYRWTWNKIVKPTGMLNCKRQPMRIVEDIAVFGDRPVYYPQMVPGEKYYTTGTNQQTTENWGSYRVKQSASDQRYPRDLLSFKREEPRGNLYPHPTKKPLDLAMYVLKTYSLENQTVLDFCMGSGTAGVACRELNRNFVGIEKNPTIFEMARKRIGI